MAHNNTVRPDAQWPPELVPTAGDARTFDLLQYQGVDGDNGGTWAPATPISIGGLGLAMTGGSHQIAGGVSTKPGSGARVVLGDNDYPTFKAAVSRQIIMSLVDWAVAPPLFANASAPVVPLLTRSLTPPSTLISAPLWSVPGNPTSPPIALAFPIPKRRVHNGSTLSSAALTLAIGLAHTSLPSAQPSFQLVRSDWFLGPVCVNFVASASYAVPEFVIPSTGYGPNGYFYAVTTAGTAGAEPGTWPTTVGATVTTGGATFTCAGQTWASSGYAGIGQPGAWQSAHAYAAGMPVQPSPATGQYFVCTGAGTSGANAPSWTKQPGTLVTDGSATWLNEGSMLPILVGQMSAGSAAAYYDGGAEQSVSLAAVTGGPSLVDTTAFSYVLLVSDESGSGALSPSMNQLIQLALSFSNIADMRFE